MKAIILAAGMGNRMGALTKSHPKGLLELNNRAILEWQMDAFRENHINDIHIVRGYKAEVFTYSDVTYWDNPDYAITNMVHSLMCARDALNEDIIVAYADIVFSPALLTDLLLSDVQVGVAVDPNWRSYWRARYGTTEVDLESLVVDDNKIVEVGQPLSSSSGVDYRYIGLLKFSVTVLNDIKNLYDAKKAKNTAWKASGNSFLQGYMTDFLSEMISKGIEVSAVASQHPWLEFDTMQDYEVNQKLIKDWR